MCLCVCVCIYVYFQPQQHRTIFQFYLISRLISNNGTARHPQWTNAGMAATKISSHRSWNIAFVTIDAICTPRLIGVYFRVLDDSSLPPRFVSPPLSFLPSPPFFSFFIFHFPTFSSQRKCVHIEIEAAWHAACWSVFERKKARKKGEGGGGKVDTLRYCERSVTNNGDISKRFTGKGKKKKKKEMNPPAVD